MAELNRIESDGPIRLEAAALSGRCLLALGELREAERVFRYVLSERSDDADAHRGLAAVAYDLGRLSEAAAHLKRVAELDPADPRPHRLTGLIFKDLMQDEAAEAAYLEALRLGLPTKDEQEVRLELAEVLIHQKKFADGLAALERAVGSAAVALRAECLIGLGEPADRTAELLDTAIREQPTAALCRLRGQLELDRQWPADAALHLERSVELDPTDHRGYYPLGQALAAVGRKAEAERALAKDAELRADLDAATKLTDEAMANPWDAGVRRRLAEQFDKMGRPQLAAMWRKAAAACERPAAHPPSSR